MKPSVVRSKGFLKLSGEDWLKLRVENAILVSGRHRCVILKKLAEEPDKRRR